MRRVARLGLRSLHILYYHVDVCRHRNVVVAYVGMWSFAGSMCAGAVAEGGDPLAVFDGVCGSWGGGGRLCWGGAEGCRGSQF